MTTEISNGEFYLATVNERRTVHNSREDAVGEIAANIDDVDIDSDDISIAEISIDGESWNIKKLSGEKLGLLLIKEAQS